MFDELIVNYEFVKNLLVQTLTAFIFVVVKIRIQ